MGGFAEAGDAKYPRLISIVSAIRCAAEDCKKISATVDLLVGEHWDYGHAKIEGSEFYAAQIYPGKHGKPFPEAVPAACLEDYDEAWAIIDLSPKSSATLARRCLQTMIRDFCDIRERSLFAEIETLERRLAEDDLPRGVEEETIEAMRALKNIGNLGAHMTERGGEILDVEPGEAQALLALIEMLFTDWYVARARRRERLARVLEIDASKNDGTSNG
ncbi:MAG: DUF4145 domain-containing protein [Sphingomonadaceae bacterium]|nr:DUF4145 domain-containing protein [Sphingomonadaceae bacterium]